MLNGKKILIEDGVGIGDLVMTTPGLRKIKELYPGAIITFVTFGNNLPVITRLPYIDICEKWDNSLCGRLHSLKVIAAQDYVIFRSYQPTLMRFAYYLRVQHRAGSCKEKNHSSIWMQRFPFNNDAQDCWDGEFVANQFAAGLGVPLPIDFRCDVSAPNGEEMAQVEQLLTQEGGSSPYVVVVPFTDSGVSLSYEVVSAAVSYIRDNYGYSVIFVNARKNPMIEKCVREIGEGVFDFAGKTNLMQLIALLKGASYGFTVDTGIMHILGALNIPTVAVFTSDVPEVWAPRKNCLPLRNPCPQSPCRGAVRDACSGDKCNKYLNVADICSAIDAVLGRGTIGSAEGNPGIRLR